MLQQVKERETWGERATGSEVPSNVNMVFSFRSKGAICHSDIFLDTLTHCAVTDPLTAEKEKNVPEFLCLGKMGGVSTLAKKGRKRRTT